MKKHIITLGGLPGSGKSTIKKILAERLQYDMFSTGDFVREMAAERNMSLEEFNEIIAHDKTIDVLIDDKLAHIEAHADRYIIDSHLAFHFVPSGFSVFLSVSPEKSAERIFNDAHSPTRIKSKDTMATYEEALMRTQKRIQNHVSRYSEHYGINPYQESRYACVIDSSIKSPMEIADEIEKAYTLWLRS